MAIKIDGNFVCIGGFCFCETPTGIEFDGEAQSTLFCDTRILQGEVSGYTSGGGNPSEVDIIDKFPFTSDASASDVGELTAAIEAGAGHSSTTHGYTSGGRLPGDIDTIQKFPFTSDSPASDVGELITADAGIGGASSFDNGYTIFNGGAIEKFPFSVDSSASDVGELVDSAGAFLIATNSEENGYRMGGFPSSSSIEKFPFADDSPATDVGELIAANYAGVPGFSSTHGYHSGGFNPRIKTIQKFPFSSDTSASSVGQLSPVGTGEGVAAGQSSITDGYVSGGADPPVGSIDTIDKFPFSTDTNASSVGELTLCRDRSMGQQI